MKKRFENLEEGDYFYRIDDKKRTILRKVDHELCIALCKYSMHTVPYLEEVEYLSDEEAGKHYMYYGFDNGWMLEK